MGCHLFYAAGPVPCHTSRQPTPAGLVLRWMRVSRGRLGLGWFGFMVVGSLGLGGRRDGNDDSSL